MKHTCFQPPSHTGTRHTGCAAHSRTTKEPALGHAFPRHPQHPMKGQALCRLCAMVPSYHWSHSSVPQSTKEKAGQNTFILPNRINPSECQLWSCPPFLIGTSPESISHHYLLFLPMQDTCSQLDCKML